MVNFNLNHPKQQEKQTEKQKTALERVQSLVCKRWQEQIGDMMKYFQV